VMSFLMICPHHQGPQIAALRDALRPQHRAWVASGGAGLAKVLTGSALWDDAGQGMGNFGILEAADEAAARAFAQGDPFAQGGVIARVDLTRLADSFQASRISPMTS
jgi:uncharacterized protein